MPFRKIRQQANGLPEQRRFGEGSASLAQELFKDAHPGVALLPCPEEGFQECCVFPCCK